MEAAAKTGRDAARRIMESLGPDPGAFPGR